MPREKRKWAVEIDRHASSRKAWSRSTKSHCHRTDSGGSKPLSAKACGYLLYAMLKRKRKLAYLRQMARTRIHQSAEAKHVGILRDLVVCTQRERGQGDHELRRRRKALNSRHA